MSITKPYTFSAGTKARSNEVNDNFDVVYNQVNTNTSRIDSVEFDITELENNKADVNGNASQRFQVADAINSNDAINKRTLENLTYNTRELISGLTITKDTNDTVIVAGGSCYSSDYTTMMVLASDTSKQNSSQGANTTYYIHLISKDSGVAPDILISQTRISPPLPEGYTKYRNIGYYKTDGDGNISIIYSYGISTSQPSSLYGIIATYINGKSGYNIWSNGYCEQWGNVAHGSSQFHTDTITFLKPFKDTNANVVAISTDIGRADDSNQGVSGVTATEFKFTHRGHATGCYWVARGYLTDGEY